jgi:hypothetical protein
MIDTPVTNKKTNTGIANAEGEMDLVRKPDNAARTLVRDNITSGMSNLRLNGIVKAPIYIQDPITANVDIRCGESKAKLLCNNVACIIMIFFGNELN